MLNQKWQITSDLNSYGMEEQNIDTKQSKLKFTLLNDFFLKKGGIMKQGF